MGLKCQESKMASRPPRQILPKGGKSNMIFFLNVFINQFAIATTPGAREIIYVINNSGGGGSVNSQLTPNSRLSNRSLKKSNSKIGNERPLHIRTDLLPARLVKDGSCGGGVEVVEEEVVGGEVSYDGEQPREKEITLIEPEGGHKEETVTVYEVVSDQECQEGDWVGDVKAGDGTVEEMVFEEEGVEEGEQVIYVTDDGHPVERDVTFMQVFENYVFQS